MNQDDLNNSLCEFAENGILFGVKRCLELGADPKVNFSRALRYAIVNGHSEIADFIGDYIRRNNLQNH